MLYREYDEYTPPEDLALLYHKNGQLSDLLKSYLQEDPPAGLNVVGIRPC
jgi:hypothetical protein